MSAKRQKISAVDAIQNILEFVENGSEEDDLEELYNEDQFEQLDQGIEGLSIISLFCQRCKFCVSFKCTIFK